jgi:hypothetical protein
MKEPDSGILEEELAEIYHGRSDWSVWWFLTVAPSTLAENAIAPRIILALKVQIRFHAENDGVAQGDLNARRPQSVRSKDRSTYFTYLVEILEHEDEPKDRKNDQIYLAPDSCFHGGIDFDGFFMFMNRLSNTAIGGNRLEVVPNLLVHM